MKKIAILMFLCPMISLAQTDAKKMEEFKKRVGSVRNDVGKIVFTFNKSTYTDKAMFDEIKKKGFVISSHMMFDETPNTNFSFIVPQKKSGTYKLDGNQSGIVKINNKVYAFKGSMVLKVNGKNINGTFAGELFEIPNGKPNPVEKSSGKVSGTFNN